MSFVRAQPRALQDCKNYSERPDRQFFEWLTDRIAVHLGGIAGMHMIEARRAGRGGVVTAVPLAVASVASRVDLTLLSLAFTFIIIISLYPDQRLSSSIPGTQIRSARILQLPGCPIHRYLGFTMQTRFMASRRPSGVKSRSTRSRPAPLATKTKSRAHPPRKAASTVTHEQGD